MLYPKELHLIVYREILFSSLLICFIKLLLTIVTSIVEVLLYLLEMICFILSSANEIQHWRS